MTSAVDLSQITDVAPHAPLVHQPEFWDARKAYAWYSPDIEGAFIEGVEFRRRHNLRTAAQIKEDGKSNAIMLTDLQHDFRDAGRLPVAGTDSVVLRACVRILNGTIGQEYYTDWIYSMDGHVPLHISYATSWRKQDGSPFDLRVNKAAVLELTDEKMGLFKATCFDPTNGSPIDMGLIQPSYNVMDRVGYWHHLEKTGQGPIWVFANHCKIGTDGTNLHPLLAETLAFVEGARMAEPTPIHKGHIRDTDWFGPLQPCRDDPNHPQGRLQKSILDRFEKVAGTIEFFGVAEDFCDFNMKKQVLDNLAPAAIRKMAFATDGTAAIVPNAPQVLAQNTQAEAKGVRFFTHDAAFAA